MKMAIKASCTSNRIVRRQKAEEPRRNKNVTREKTHPSKKPQISSNKCADLPLRHRLTFRMKEIDIVKECTNRFWYSSRWRPIILASRASRAVP
jgi:hypothetical protein